MGDCNGPGKDAEFLSQDSRVGMGKTGKVFKIRLSD